MTEIKRLPLFSIQTNPDQDNSIQPPIEKENKQTSIEENILFEEKEDYSFNDFEKDFFC
jgi:hypothetical protein